MSGCDKIMFKKINNYDEYLELTRSLFNNSYFEDDYEKWHMQFGSEEMNPDLEIDELTSPYEYNGELDLSPSNDKYPIILYYGLENEYGRFGVEECFIWDWVSLNGI